MKNTIILRNIFLSCLFNLVLLSCSDNYRLNVEYSVPTQLYSPGSIELDVTSSSPVIFSWDGRGADDGGIVLYDVLFDKIDGDFSAPLARMKSDMGARKVLTVNHAIINNISKNAGIRPGETGELKWTVSASKGGTSKISQEVGSFSVTRGDGIDNIPTSLYLVGSCTENNGETGLMFRQVKEGVFQIYTKLHDGLAIFRSDNGDNSLAYYVGEDNKLKEGEHYMNIKASPEIVRLTVDFNTLSVTKDQISKSVRCIWGATFDNIAVLDYVGNGLFRGNGKIRFISQDRPDTNPPGWLSWTEDRYYFIASVNGSDMCWGRGSNVSENAPAENVSDSFYELHEYPWSQWDHLWKMKSSLDETYATITINTNINGLKMHSFSNVTPIK